MYKFLMCLYLLFCYEQGKQLLDINFPEGPFGTKVRGDSCYNA